MVSVAYHILCICCKEISGYQMLFHHKGKLFTKQLLNFVLPIVQQIDSEENIKEYFEETKNSIDQEELKDDTALHLGCVTDLVEIFMTQTPTQVFETSLALTNLREGKKMYTQNEVDILINEKRNN